MTRDLSSLALPDSPELPAEIEAILDSYARAFLSYGGDRDARLQSARKAIAQHLLTAEEAQTLECKHEEVCRYRGILDDDWECNCGAKATQAKLRLLSGSSRGEE